MISLEQTCQKREKPITIWGGLGGSVFIDFNRTINDEIYLVRISFDGFGCCDLRKLPKSLTLEDSKKFIEEIEKEDWNQNTVTKLVKEAIDINSDQIWTDALEKYGLI